MNINSSLTPKTSPFKKHCKGETKNHNKINVFNLKNTRQLHNNHESRPLTSRKKNIHDNQPVHPDKHSSENNPRNIHNLLKPATEIKYLESKENRLSPIRQKLEHTPFIPQSINSKTIIEHQPKLNFHHKKQRKRTQQKNKKILLTKYWNNKAPLCVLGKNAEILKTGLNKNKTKTKVFIPESLKKRINKNPEHHQLVNPHYWNKLVGHWLSLKKNERLHTIDSLLQHTIIAKTDPRKKLHGQSGVLAARDIPPYCVIAPYAGLYCVGSDVLRETAHYGSNVGRYAVDCSMDNIQIYLCGYGHGNITLCINANTTYSEKDPVLKDNTCFVFVIYQGWPYAFVVSMEPIRKGCELLIDYGRNYWTGMKPANKK